MTGSRSYKSESPSHMSYIYGATLTSQWYPILIVFGLSSYTAYCTSCIASSRLTGLSYYLLTGFNLARYALHPRRG
jgi:hypothetical protein